MQLNYDEYSTGNKPLELHNKLDQSVEWFRQASPYINAHRGKTFVIALSGDAVADDNFPALIHDIALLHHLGIRLVLVYGIRHQIEKSEKSRKITSKIVNNLRITDSQTLETVIDVAGSVRTRIESAVSASLPNTPMSGARLSIVSGNFVTARPFGIHDGIDYGHTGVIRRVHANAINSQLENGNIVLLSPLGYSITGETFNLHAEDVAAKTAEALGAEKLTFLLDAAVVDSKTGEPLNQTTPAQMKALVSAQRVNKTPQNILLNSIEASLNGIKRVHLLDRHVNGALLKEFFTRDGVGTLVSADNYDGLRQASITDVGGIIDLITPLEIDGTLVRRSREQLELEIDNFAVFERDGTIVACAALYTMGDFGEIACVATHPEYRKSGRAEKLMDYFEHAAKRAGLKKLFVFTTRTKHWFLEQGFEPASVDDLPAERQSSYNFKRNSGVLIKSL